jgi:hypothetical protein
MQLQVKDAGAGIVNVSLTGRLDTWTLVEMRR